MFELTSKGLHCFRDDFYVDPHRAVEKAVITHAHSDHARKGCGEYFCSPNSVELLKTRLGKNIKVTPIPYGETFRLRLDGVKLSFHGAGHILGSAQVRAEHLGETWVVTGDYKRDDDPSCEPFEVVRCDTFVSEATFGRPQYRWRPVKDVMVEVVDWWIDNSEEGHASVIHAYSLGKTQRVLAELAREPRFGAKRTVYLHPSMEELVECYRRASIEMAPTEVLTKPLPRRDAIVIAPPGSSDEFYDLIGSCRTAFASGWTANRAKNPGKWALRGSDRGFPISDHADWDALNRTIAESGASRVFTRYGYPDDLARYLRKLGREAYALNGEDTSLRPKSGIQLALPF